MEVRELIAQIEERAIIVLDGEELPEFLGAAEVLVRRLISREAAERLVGDRLHDYERMWDGCGCKIDYHD